MIKKYKAKRKGFLLFVLLFLPLPIIGYWLSEDQRVLTTVVLAVPVLLLLWVYFDTWYMVSEGKLFYRSAFLRGSIRIDQITQVIIGKTMWSGTKPAMAKNGLIIKYGFDEIYIAPDNNDEFVHDLRLMNPNINFVGEAVGSESQEL